MKKIVNFTVILSFLFTTSIFADGEQMNIALARASDQLEQVKALLVQAQQEQTKDNSVKVHFSSWVDGNGNTHSGLLDDVTSIQKGILDAINKTNNGPRTITPIANDFTTNNGN